MGPRKALLLPCGQSLSDSFGRGGTDLFVDLECGFGVVDGVSAIAKLIERQAHVPERVPLTAPVCELAADGESLFVVLDCAPRLA